MTHESEAMPQAPVGPVEHTVGRPVPKRASYTDDPEQTGVGDWCCPGPAAQQRRVFVLRFEDKDRSEAHFYDEDEARRMFARAEALGWNCHLMAHLPRRV